MKSKRKYLGTKLLADGYKDRDREEIQNSVIPADTGVHRERMLRRSAVADLHGANYTGVMDEPIYRTI